MHTPTMTPWQQSQCTMNKPLLLVIPPGGIHVACPIHGSHFLVGPQVTC